MDLRELLKKRVLGNKLILLDRKTKFTEHFIPALFQAVRRRISQLFVVKIPHLLGMSEFVSATTFFGLPLKVLRRDKFCIDNWGVIGGGADILTIWFFVETIRKGATVIDGGAYIGWYTALAAELVGQDGSVHSFEPTPGTFPILQQNIAGKRNVYLNQMALAERTGAVEFYDFGDRFGYLNTISSQEQTGADLDHSTVSKSLRRIKVGAVRLDDYCARTKIRPDFIKLDLEGGEYSALLGAKEVLRTYKPVVVVEVAKKMIENGTYDKMANFLEAYGYRAYRMSTDENFNIYFHPFSSNHVDGLNLENIIFATLSPNGLVINKMS